jgi:hypothetical protein
MPTFCWKLLSPYLGYNIEPAGSSETFALIYLKTWCHTPKDSNIKFYFIILCNYNTFPILCQETNMNTGHITLRLLFGIHRYVHVTMIARGSNPGTDNVSNKTEEGVFVSRYCSLRLCQKVFIANL